MKNPFEYGGISKSSSFCNRTQELKELSRLMENGQNIFLFSERRMGKTSLIKKTLKSLDSKKIKTAYVDLWPTNNAEDLVKATAKAIATSISTNTETLLKNAKEFFSRFLPTLNLNEKGEATLNFNLQPSVNSIENSTESVEDVLNISEKIAKKTKMHMVIVFDEFQQIYAYPSDKILRTIRSIVQHQTHVSYVFMGSQKHLIKNMVSERSNPFYKSGTPYSISPIPLKHWKPFIKRKFSASKKSIDDTNIEIIFELTKGHPFFTQHLCHVIWESVNENSSVTSKTISNATETILKRDHYSYLTLWETLTMNQKKFLFGLAKQGEVQQILGKSFLTLTKLYAPSLAQSAARVLKEKSLVDHENGYYISDLFFKLWIEQEIMYF